MKITEFEIGKKYRLPYWSNIDFYIKATSKYDPVTCSDNTTYVFMLGELLSSSWMEWQEYKEPKSPEQKLEEIKLICHNHMQVSKKVEQFPYWQIKEILEIINEN